MLMSLVKDVMLSGSNMNAQYINFTEHIISEICYALFGLVGLYCGVMIIWNWRIIDKTMVVKAYQDYRKIKLSMRQKVMVHR